MYYNMILYIHYYNIFNIVLPFSFSITYVSNYNINSRLYYCNISFCYNVHAMYIPLLRHSCVIAHVQTRCFLKQNEHNSLSLNYVNPHSCKRYFTLTWTTHPPHHLLTLSSTPQCSNCPHLNIIDAHSMRQQI